MHLLLIHATTCMSITLQCAYSSLRSLCNSLKACARHVAKQTACTGSAFTFYIHGECLICILCVMRMQDMRRDTLCHVKRSPKLMLGTGYAVHMLGAPAEAYTLGPSGRAYLDFCLLPLLPTCRITGFGRCPLPYVAAGALKQYGIQ